MRFPVPCAYYILWNFVTALRNACALHVRVTLCVSSCLALCMYVVHAVRLAFKYTSASMAAKEGFAWSTL